MFPDSNQSLVNMRDSLLAKALVNLSKLCCREVSGALHCREGPKKWRWKEEFAAGSWGGMTAIDCPERVAIRSTSEAGEAALLSEIENAGDPQSNEASLLDIVRLCDPVVTERVAGGAIPASGKHLYVESVLRCHPRESLQPTHQQMMATQNASLAFRQNSQEAKAAGSLVTAKILSTVCNDRS